jgi:hypothetical protein
MVRDRTWLLAIALQALGCGSAGVYDFSARPRQVCPQTKTITLNWAVDGNASLSSQPPLPDLGDGPAVARHPVAWTGGPPGGGDTTVTLTASRRFGKPTLRQQIIHVVTPGQASTLAPDRSELTCDQAHGAVIGVAQFEADEYDDAVVIQSLHNAAARPITVTHRGGVWTVPPQQEIALAEQRPNGRSTTASGPWVISAPLLAGEVCFTPSARAALNLALETRLACRVPAGGTP